MERINKCIPVFGFKVKMFNTKNVNIIYIIILISIFLLLTIQNQTSTILEGSNSRSDSSILSFDIRYVEEKFTSLEQTDPQLIQYTRARFLTPPSKQPYNLTTEVEITPLAKWVLNFFGNKTKGTFIEAGAHDGESHSNTLYLEKFLGWRGVLIECNPVLVPDIIAKHRKAWVGNVCLAPGPIPGNFRFRFPTNYTVAGTLGAPLHELDAKRPAKFLDVQAVPLYTILAALGWKEIDYFSFDVEGVEFDLLKHFPFDEVIFKVIIMEIQFYSSVDRFKIRKFLAKHGYFFVMYLSFDYIYVHESVLHILTNESSSVPFKA